MLIAEILFSHCRFNGLASAKVRILSNNHNLRRLQIFKEALQEAYESLADALQAVTPNEPHPLASEAFSNQFKWHKSVGDEGTVFILRHNELDYVETFIPEVCPYLPEQYFTKEALDFIKKNNH